MAVTMSVYEKTHAVQTIPFKPAIECGLILNPAKLRTATEKTTFTQ